MGGSVIVELCWWAVCNAFAHAPAPLTIVYLVMAFAGLGSAILVRFALGHGWPERWKPALAGTILAGVGASLFLPLKYAIPTVIPFWLDPPLANIEASLFGSDPWRLLDPMLGWAAVPVDRVYAIWLPIQSLILFSVMLAAPSRAKSRALIAYSLGWLVLGVGAALILSSAGPIFYDRLFSGTRFAALHDMLIARGAWMVLAESDAMWMSHATGHPGLVAGISAMPSNSCRDQRLDLLGRSEHGATCGPIRLGLCAFHVDWVGPARLALR